MPYVQVVTSIPVETSLTQQDTPDAAQTWVQMINRAEKSLDLAFFYLAAKEGGLLEPVIQALLNAAGRSGVRIRILVGTAVNDDMAQNNQAVCRRFAGIKNITVREFNWKTLNNGILHAKYFIVDGREVFVGSQNFDWRSLEHIHETGLRIRERGVAIALAALFEADWQYNSGDADAYLKAKRQKPLIQSKDTYIIASPSLYNPAGLGDSLDELVRLIQSARKKITVQLLNYHVDIYHSTEKFTIIDQALRQAAARGVKINIIVSDWNKKRPAVDGLKNLVKVPGIEIKFCTIPAFSKGFIPYARVHHSKVMRVDDHIAWVGTSNWGKEYFFQSRNVEVVTHDIATAGTLDRLFAALWSSNYTYTVEPEKEYVPPRKR